MCIHIGVCHVAVTDTPCISCSCHWQFLKYPVCTFHTIFHWHIYTQSEFHTLVYWNISCVHFSVVIETYFYSIACQGMVDLTKTTFIRIPHPPPTKTWPVGNYEKRRKKQLSSRTNAEMYTSKISERGLTQTLYTYTYVYTVKIRQTRYTYHLFAAWIGGICWPKGFAYIYLYPKYRLPINPRQRDREINLCAMSSLYPMSLS